VEPVRPSTSTTITVRATNGANYSPVLPEISSTVATYSQTPRKNFLVWSNDNQPEHVPTSNSTFVGSGEIVSMVGARDALWIFCTDGLYRLSGTGGQWDLHPVDPTCIISGPQCAGVLNDTVYAYTNKGLVAITDAGVEHISQGILNDLLPGPSYVETAKLQLCVDENNDEVYLLIQSATLGSASTLYCYSQVYKRWSTITFSDMRVTYMAYIRYPATAGADGYPVLAWSQQDSAPPFYALWDSASGTNLKPTVLLQPFYGDDPWLLKQWIDATWICDIACADNAVVSTFNNTTTYGTSTLVSHLTDSRATFGVPRSCAIRAALSPGLKMTTTPALPLVIKGVSLRHKLLTRQQESRQ
jgi:hypothetical protein